MLSEKLARISLLCAFACSSPAKPAIPADPAAPAGSATSASEPAGVTTTAAEGPGLGQTCGDDDSCAKGTCVAYSGIAGPKGPQFKTCEIKCTGGGACPDGTKCIVVADGPGAVCR
jgi:hypothetical protein